ncbi:MULTISPECIES: hypothetical protein [Amycolatopsis]|uniref:hypothetical protein n=1 Tax=Amycolatopsis TaxID=1813 RepID=UPI000B8A8726|nr:MULTISPECIES: hypothetical protein [Amycolatopsis]OXM73697.1 hypothetical protein CF166_08390 [Amycolatopsis sp. KNN50.9b]
MRTLLLAAIATTAAALPATASATPAPTSAVVADQDIITTCGPGYSGYIRRPGKDALCLQPGTRTWTGFQAFECKGNITVYFKNGKHVECGGGIDFEYNGGVVKTVAR